MQQNETNPWQSDGPLDAGRWIPLVTLAIEGFGTGLIENGFDRRYERLRYELRDEILCDDVGIPHIPRTLAATMIREDLEIMAPVKLSEVEGAQQNIVKTVRRLETEGRIAISRGGGDEFI